MKLNLYRIFNFENKIEFSFLFFLIILGETVLCFGQDTYKPYMEGYLDKKPYQYNSKPYALKSHEQVIEGKNELVYEINTDGTLNPLNDELVIENCGDVDIINPRITINDKWNWYTCEAMANEIVRDAATDREKAIAISQFVHNNRYHFQPPGKPSGKDYVSDPVIGLNIFGHMYCGMAARITSTLAKKAGLDARLWGLYGHIVSEIFYDGEWHLFDSDAGVFYLNKDNKTIAGMDDLVKDPWLVERTYHPGLAGWKQAHPRRTSTGAWSDGMKTVINFYTTTENNEVEEVEPGDLYEMDLTLRPGEKIILRWDNVGKFYNKYLFTEPLVYANGKIVYKPDLTDNSYRKHIESETNIKSVADDGKRPNIHVDSCITEDTWRSYEANIIYKVKCPYVIVGGCLTGNFYRNDKYGDFCQIELSFDGKQWIPVWTAPTTGWINHNQVLDGLISPVGKEPKYEYYVKMNFAAAGAGFDRPQEPGDNTQAGIDNFTLTTDFQVNPLSIPALSLGLNKVSYTDQTEGRGKVKITHRWYRRDDNHYPDAPVKPLYPADKEVIDSLTPLLRWEEARDIDKNDKIIDYHIQLSARPDFKWPLSANFDRDAGSGAAEWQVPKGWLNPDQTYYWRVKAKDKNGNWGGYSKGWSFTTR
ncbi:hypothetical protein JXQ31_02170 [candidate division KSB1 bacterium]|nr:hypothetical protein [candidate division KSB1 bacterium]